MSLYPERTTRSLTTALTALAALSLFAPSAAARPQEPTADAAATEELPEGRAIIDRFLEETGTRKALAEHRSRKASGTIELVGMGLKGTFELMQAKPSSMLLVMELPGVGSIRNGYDGKIAWATNPMMGPMLIDGTALGQLRLQAHFDAQMHDPARYAVIETVGRTEFEGEDCHRVRLVAKPTEDLGEETEKLREIFEYYSVESGLLMGTESLNASPMGEMKVRSYYSDYVELGGVKTPRTVVQDAGMQKMKLVTEEFEWDTVPADAFELPEEIVALVEGSQPTEAAAKSDGE